MNTHSNRKRRRPVQHGFTLVEIMVVVVILGLLGTMVVQNVIGMSEDARLTKAQTDTKTIYDSAKLWRAQKGKWPTIEDLTQPDDKGRVALELLPEDPWGNAYVMRPGEGTSVEVISWGPDGYEDTDDDISSRQQKTDR